MQYIGIHTIIIGLMFGIPAGVIMGQIIDEHPLTAALVCGAAIALTVTVNSIYIASAIRT